MGQMEDLHLQRAWKNALCDVSYTNAAECSPSLSRKEWEDLSQKGAEMLRQISDLLRRWQKAWIEPVPDWTLSNPNAHKYFQIIFSRDFAAIAF